MTKPKDQAVVVESADYPGKWLIRARYGTDQNLFRWVNGQLMYFSSQKDAQDFADYKLRGIK